MKDMYIKIRKTVVGFQARSIGALIQQDATVSGAQRTSCSMGTGGGGGGGFFLGFISLSGGGGPIISIVCNF